MIIKCYKLVKWHLECLHINRSIKRANITPSNVFVLTLSRILINTEE